nr:galactoside alpha-(1,2)-fucosyltransferase 2-like [Procambarus clarkii]
MQRGSACVVVVLVMSTASYLLIDKFSEVIPVYTKMVNFAPRPVSNLLQPVSRLILGAFYSDSEMKDAGFNTSVVSAKWCLPQPRYLPLPPDNQRNCSLPYVTMNTGGQLGNKLCQYLSLVLIRRVFGVRVAILEAMNGSISGLFHKLSLPVEDHKCFPGYSAKLPFSNLYRKLFINNTGNGIVLSNSRLRHYPLSVSSYVEDCPCPSHLLVPLRDLFRHELPFRQDIIDKAKERLDNAVKSLHNNTSQNITVVTVHVRRTDHLSFIKGAYNLDPLDKTYFQRAFNFYRNRTAVPVFVVTSDDPKWCQSNIMDKDVVYAGSRDPVSDLVLLSLGDHHVITYGTFGFVSAFLGRGIIVYPDPTGWPVFPCFNSTIIQPINRD